MIRAGIVIAAVTVGLFASSCTQGPKLGNLTFGVSPEAHEQYFPIAAGFHALGKPLDGGETIGCASCHASTASFQQFDCTTCHKTMDDGLEVHSQQRMNERHAGVSQYVFDSVQCLACHPRGDLLAGSISREDHDAYFPIATGTAHQSITCTSCHLDQGNFADVRCTTCHEHDQPTMVVAHGPEMEALGYRWDTAGCRECHARSENPGTIDHTPFPIEPSSVHGVQEITCAECHADRQDRGNLGCIDCHRPATDGSADTEHGEARMAQKHGDTPGYAWESTSCYLCHQQAQVPGEIDHARFFPIGSGDTHALGTVLPRTALSSGSPTTALDCVTCHLDQSNQRDVTCTQCHLDTDLTSTHDQFPDYNYDDASCVFCHLGGERNLNHTFFPVEPTDIHKLNVGAVTDGMNCDDCHASHVNRTLLDCTGCHLGTHDTGPTNDAHGTMDSYTYDSQACFQCHRTSQVPGTYDHEAHFPLVNAPSGSPSAHRGLQCADCHTSKTNRSQLACTTCHTAAPDGSADTVHGQTYLGGKHGGVPNYQWTPASCFGCHPDGTADNAVFNHPYFPIATGDKHNGLSCDECHTTGDYAQVDCIACHRPSPNFSGQEMHSQQAMTQQHNGVPGFNWATTACLLCHPNSEHTGIIDHEQFFPLRAPSPHATVSCNGCHTNPNNNSVVDCVTCHRTVNTPAPLATVHNGIPSYQENTAACRNCHPQGQPVGTMNHTAYFPINAGSKHASGAYNAKIGSNQTQCSACHSSYADRSQNTCATCHAGVSPTPATSHGNVRGYVNNSVNCKECHADSQVDPVSSHTAFSYRHEGAKCVDCHRSHRTDKPWAINWSIGVCTKCHSASCTPSNRGPCD